MISSKLKDFFAMSPDQGSKIKFLSLPNSPLLTKRTLKTLAQGCPNLEYLNVSGCVKLSQVFIAKEEWPLLARLEAKDCPKLEKVVTYSPMKILRIGTESKIEIFVAKSTLDILTFSTNQFDFYLKREGGFEIKGWGRTITDENFVLHTLREKEEVDKYFKNLKITIGKNSILSGKDLEVFVSFIRLSNANLKPEEIQKLTQLKLFNLKRLDIHFNPKLETGSLEYLIQGDWPKLNYLNLSFSEMNDEGFQILSCGNWPLLETLNLEKTEMTAVGIEAIVKRSNWFQLKHLNLSGNKIDDEGGQILAQGTWPLLETLILQNVSMSSLALEAIAKKSNWPNLKYLDIFGNKIDNKLVQGNWQKLETLNLEETEITALEIEAIVKESNWPRLRHLNISWNQIKDEGLEILARGNWPLAETLNLSFTKVTKKGLLNFILNLNWPNLQEIIYLSDTTNFAQNLFENNWLLLEGLDLSSSEITQNEIEAIVYRFKWPNLKSLNLSNHQKIDDDGLAILSQGNWPLLETLNLDGINVTKKRLLNLILKTNWLNLREIVCGSERKDLAQNILKQNCPHLEKLDLSSDEITQNEIEIIVKKCQWPRLKHLNLSNNSEITNFALQMLAQGNWPLLETLNLDSTGVTKKGLASLILETKWSNLKEIICMSIGEDFTKSLFKENWYRLEKLDLSSSEITPHEIETIIKKCNWPRLKHFDLSDNPGINDEALQMLTQGDLPELETLNLEDTNVTKKGSLNFLWKTNWPKFMKITLPECWDNISQNLALCFIRKDFSWVEKLELSHLNLENTDIETIVNQCPKLKYLNVSDYNLSFETFSALACPLLEELNIENTKITPKGIAIIVNQSKWFQLKHLNISNNSIFDEGISMLSLVEWQQLEELNLKNTKITAPGIKILVSKVKLLNLKKLDVSENSILDEGLETIASGDWPLFEHLVFYNTKVTLKGNIALLKKFTWPNLRQLENSLSESFYNYNKSSSEIILAAVPTHYKGQSLLVIALNMTWFNSKEIELLMGYSGLKKKSILLPHNKWHQLEQMNLSVSTSSTQSIIWPSNLKTLSLNNSSLFEEKSIENLFHKNYPPLECLNLHKTGLTTKGIEVLFSQFNLRKLDISGNLMTDEKLEILVSAKWKLLQELNLESTNLTYEGTKILIGKSEWPNLKKLDVSNNPIQDKGLEILTTGKWNLLEDVNLGFTGITTQGIEILINKSDWPNLKELNVSDNIIQDSGAQILTSGKWQTLEHLNLANTKITTEGIEKLISPDCPKLKKLDVSGNPLQDKGLQLLSSGKWPELECLYLRSTSLTDEGIESMASLSDWSLLKFLDVSSNYDISGKGIEALVEGKWPLLERLYLGCSISIELKDAKTLVTKSSWPHLKEIQLGIWSSSEREIIQTLIYKKWPKVKITLH